MSVQTQRWVVGRYVPDAPQVRLLAFAQAGGGAGSFAGWRGHLPPHVELAPVELPGRGTRQSEPLPGDLGELVADLADGLRDELAGEYVLFGHSFGALLAYELAGALIEAGRRPPRALLVSGARAPQAGTTELLHRLGDDELLAHLRQINGIPEILLRHPAYVRTVVAAVRADLRMAELYRRAEPFRLPCPVHAFGSRDDPVAGPEALERWERCAGTDFSLTLYPGDHFYLYEDPAPVLRDLAGAIEILQ